MLTQETRIIRCTQYNTWEVESLLNQGFRALDAKIVITEVQGYLGPNGEMTPAPPIVEVVYVLLRDPQPTESLLA